MKNILFINTRKSQCSIYEDGQLFFQSILSNEFNFVYTEIDKLDKNKLHEGIIQLDGTIKNFDVIVINYHPITMRQVEGIDSFKLKKNLKAKTISLIFEMEIDQPFPKYYNLNEDHFDEYIVFDPTLKTQKLNVHPFPRPMPYIREMKMVRKIPDIPVIGSFGLPGVDKNMPKIIEQASKEFFKSIVRINIPSATYMGDSLKQYIIDELINNPYKNVQLEITDDYMSEENLLNWCAKNDINMFLYSRDSAGLSSVTDYVIIAGTPLLVSSNKTFRHLHPYIGYFPELTIKQALLTSQDGIKRIREDWSKDKCSQKFKKIIKEK